MQPTAVTIAPEQHGAIKAHLKEVLRKTGHVAENALEVVASAALAGVIVAAGAGGAFQE